MADSYVQVAPDAGGKQIDSQALTNAAGTTIYRQTIVLADPVNLASMLSVDPSGILQNYGQYDRLRISYMAATFAQLNVQTGGAGNGFVPVETPDFLTGN